MLSCYHALCALCRPGRFGAVAGATESSAVLGHHEGGLHLTGNQARWHPGPMTSAPYRWHTVLLLQVNAAHPPRSWHLAKLCSGESRSSCDISANPEEHALPCSNVHFGCVCFATGTTLPMPHPADLNTATPRLVSVRHPATASKTTFLVGGGAR